MRHKKLFGIVTITCVVLINGCKKDTERIIIPIQIIAQTAVPLGSTANFAVVAGASINSTGATVITGDLGLSPGSSTTGFPPAVLNGTMHINDATAIQAKLDLTTAYNDAAVRSSTDRVILSGNLGGLTLTPGLYKSTSSLEVSSGDLNFDAKGNSEAVFVIQITSALTITSGRKVILSGGAQASNIFWQVGSAATLGTNSVFKGTIIAMQSISFSTGSTLDGKAFTRNGSVTMEANTVVKH